MRKVCLSILMVAGLMVPSFAHAQPQCVQFYGYNLAPSDQVRAFFTDYPWIESATSTRITAGSIRFALITGPDTDQTQTYVEPSFDVWYDDAGRTVDIPAAAVSCEVYQFAISDPSRPAPQVRPGSKE